MLYWRQEKTYKVLADNYVDILRAFGVLALIANFLCTIRNDTE